MKRILIAEDESFLAKALKDNLKAEGYAVDIVPDGDGAINYLRTKKVDIILLDLLMPKRDGFFVLEEIKKNPECRNIPVIVLSNLGGDTEIKRALEMGAVEYFVKSQHPISEVVEKVKKISEGLR